MQIGLTGLIIFLAALTHSTLAWSEGCTDLYTRLYNKDGVSILHPYRVSATTDGIFVTSPVIDVGGEKFPNGQKHFFTYRKIKGNPSGHVWCHDHLIFARGPNPSQASCSPLPTSVMLNGDDGKSVIGMVEIDPIKKVVTLTKNVDPMAKMGKFTRGEERIELRVEISTDSTVDSLKGIRSELVAQVTAFDSAGKKAGSFENRKTEYSATDDPKPHITGLKLEAGKEFKRRGRCTRGFEEVRNAYSKDSTAVIKNSAEAISPR